MEIQVHSNMNRSNQESRITFRPDIEGLRALAVGLVIASHAKLPFLRGGFVGVDVFLFSPAI
jgi:peptidoglycan/LPS O-acetylase OafA/YrhL